MRHSLRALSRLSTHFTQIPSGSLSKSRLAGLPVWLVVVLGLGLLIVSCPALAQSEAARETRVAANSAAPSTIPADSAMASEAPTPGAGIPVDPSWPKTLTVVTDSVMLAVGGSLQKALPEWKVTVLGRPALPVRQAVPEFLKNRRVGSVVVIGLAYNSVFEKNKKNYEHWCGFFDYWAEHLLADLKERGAKKLIWVTLREPSPELVTERGRDQYKLYAWFFPYVNERLHALAARHPELGIADWAAVSNIPNVTRDLIHLNTAGTKLMTETVVKTVLGPEPTPPRANQ